MQTEKYICERLDESKRALIELEQEIENVQRKPFCINLSNFHKFEASRQTPKSRKLNQFKHIRVSAKHLIIASHSLN